MRARSMSIIAAAFVTLAVVFLVCPLTTQAAGQKGKKGKNIPPLMRAEFRDSEIPNSSGKFVLFDAHIQSDGGVYLDERALGGDQGVEAFLFGSGNFGLRLEGSGRTVTLDFSKPVLVGDVGDSVKECFNAEGSPEKLPLLLLPGVKGPDGDHETKTIDVTVRELANIGIVFFYTDACEYGGLLCIPIGERRASGFYLRWDEPNMPNTRFGVKIRTDSFDHNGPHEVMITRCTTDSMGDPTPEECTGITTTPENTWIISTRSGYGLGTGPQACVFSQSIKGKPTTTQYGVFEMPFELVVSCVNPDCS